MCSKKTRADLFICEIISGTLRLGEEKTLRGSIGQSSCFRGISQTCIALERCLSTSFFKSLWRCLSTLFFRSPEDGDFQPPLQHKHSLEKGLGAGSSHSPASVGDTGWITTCTDVDLGLSDAQILMGLGQPLSTWTPGCTLSIFI